MIIKNRTGVEIPDYLDKKFFQHTLEDGLREYAIEPKKVIFEWGSNPGDNYFSYIYQVKISFQRSSSSHSEDISVIIKMVPVTQAFQFLFDSGSIVTEKSMYWDVIPRLEVLLDNVKLGGKLLYALQEPIHTIVLEDLKVSGFRNAYRQDGLDFNHCKIILEKLGQLHGSSMVLAKKDPSLLDRFNKGMLSVAVIQKSTDIGESFRGNVGKLIELASTWPGYENIDQKLKKHHSNFWEDIVHIGRPRPGEITVLNHGDIWPANFMFRYDKKDPQKPIDAVFIDFQMSFFGSPGWDINFFLNTAVQYDVLVNQREELVAIYYKSFADTLKSLNYANIPTMQDMKNELGAREAHGFFAMYSILCIAMLPDAKSVNMVSESEEVTQVISEGPLSNKKLYKFFKYSLKRFDELGVLDQFEV